jgi:hypothetical protein
LLKTNSAKRGVVGQNTPELKGLVLEKYVPKFDVEGIKRHIQIGEAKGDMAFRGKQFAIDYLLANEGKATLDQVINHLTRERNMALSRHEIGQLMKDLVYVGAIEGRKTEYKISKFFRTN